MDSITLHAGPDPAWDAALMAGTAVARPRKAVFAWCGGIVPGMPEAKVLKILKRESVSLTRTKDGWETKAGGSCPLVSSHEPLRVWTAKLVFTHGSLSLLTLDARSGQP